MRFWFLIIVLLFFSEAGFCRPLLFYIHGDHHYLTPKEESGSLETGDFSEFQFQTIARLAPPNSDIGIFYDPYEEGVSSALILIKKGTIIETRRMGETNVSDPETLHYFIEESLSLLDDKKVSLFYWGHGFQREETDSFDLSHPENFYSINQFKESLLQSGRHFELLFFGACQMASFESALILSPFSDYLIASVYPLSHKTKFASFLFLPFLTDVMTTEDYIDLVLEENRRNSRENSLLDTQWTAVDLKAFDNWIVKQKWPEVSEDVSQYRLDGEHFTAEELGMVLDMTKIFANASDIPFDTNLIIGEHTFRQFFLGP